MKELMVKGTQTFLGKEIPVIEGGFGEDQKVILVKTVAEIHDEEVKRINQIINRNRDEFEDGIDIIDLKGNEEFEDTICNHEILTQNAINRATNIYLLSEQGYMALVNLMRTEKAKEIRKQLRREYFAMRKVIKENSPITEKHLKDMEKRLENKTRMEMEILVGGYQKALVGMQNQMIDFQKQQQDLMMDFMEKVVNKLTNKPTVVNVKKEKYMTISDIIKGSKYKSATAANNILEKHSIVYREYYTEDGKEKFRTLATDSAIVLGLAINDPQNGYTRVLYTPKGISTVREILGLDDEQQISFDDPMIININR